ncbi:MAG: CYTH domain-containing protein [Victivallales bacterium]
MGTEIERKFLLKDDSWRSRVLTRTLCRQAYIHFREQENGVLRVRIAGEKGYLTLKGPVQGCTRSEYEYEIPFDDANALIHDFCEGPVVEKYRNIVMNGADRWEIDEFLGDNQGLVLAELELASEDSVFEHPAWLGEEVTGQPGYYNSFLARNPYKTWKQTTETKSKGDKTE